jgi:hypothetical protein
MMDPQTPLDPKSATRTQWRNTLLMAVLVVLGVTPWAKAQLPLPDLPAICPPITAFAVPSLFDLYWGTTPIKFPYA